MTFAKLGIGIFLFVASSLFLRAQTLTVLHSFTGNADGAFPYGGVVLDHAGNLYGTTATGGRQKHGTIYQIDSSGNFATLHQFDMHDGCESMASLLLDDAGNLYGTTYLCGSSTVGTVFELQKFGEEFGKLVALHEFSGDTDVSEPRAGLVRDKTGDLYGTGSFWGSSSNGGVFKVDDKTGNETVLYDFGPPPDGAAPSDSLILDVLGNLYGTTTLGGPASGFGYGTVFKLDPSGAETMLWDFTGGSDGANPIGGLILDRHGNFYGTSSAGGLGFSNAGYGTLFKLDPSGNLTVLHVFGSFFGDAATPAASLAADSDGNLYGTSQAGGTWGNGSVFELDKAGNYTVPYSFTGGADGQSPFDRLTIDAAGNLYGTTAMGGDALCECGTVFRLSLQ